MHERQLRMVRPNFDTLPGIALPDDITIRTYREGDEALWASIVNTGLGGSHTEHSAHQELTDRLQFDPAGLFFAVLDGEAVGTACAWRERPEECEVGYVHMVCVRPEAQGRGLGYLLTLHVLHYFRDRGFSSAILDTDDFRIPAIKSYLRLGFRPRYFDLSHAERWERLAQDAGLALPEEVAEAVLI
ncbi:MAG: GNAT family N-acetyltransferase [Armatimonadetes bacterium]|nr:GNAT family N-acetyltransferase [Armatimonadota bacterium]